MGRPAVDGRTPAIEAATRCLRDYFHLDGADLDEALAEFAELHPGGLDPNSVWLTCLSATGRYRERHGIGWQR